MNTYYSDQILVQMTAQEMKDLYAAVADMADNYDQPELEGNVQKARYEKLLADLRYMLSQQPWW